MPCMQACTGGGCGDFLSSPPIPPRPTHHILPPLTVNRPPASKYGATTVTRFPPVPPCSCSALPPPPHSTSTSNGKCPRSVESEREMTVTVSQGRCSRVRAWSSPRRMAVSTPRASAGGMALCFGWWWWGGWVEGFGGRMDPIYIHTHRYTHTWTNTYIYIHTHITPDVGEEEEPHGRVVRQLPSQGRGRPLAQDGKALDALRAGGVVCFFGVGGGLGGGGPDTYIHTERHAAPTDPRSNPFHTYTYNRHMQSATYRPPPPASAATASPRSRRRPVAAGPIAPGWPLGYCCPHHPTRPARAPPRPVAWRGGWARAGVALVGGV